MPEMCASVSLSRGGAVTMAIQAPQGAIPGDAPQGAFAGDAPVLVLAHGAGNDFRSPFLEHLAGALCERGIAVVRFNFPFKERPGTRPPDRMDVLADCFHDVLLAQARRTGAPPGPLFVGGKSMGGRVAAALVADGRAEPSGLVFLGYPLHRAGEARQPKREGPRAGGHGGRSIIATRADSTASLHKAGDRDRLRDADLRRLGRPALFVQGTRDALCDLELLRALRKEARIAGALHVVDGGDHSLQLPRSRAAEQPAALSGAADAVAAFIRKVLARR